MTWLSNILHSAWGMIPWSHIFTAIGTGIAVYTFLTNRRQGLKADIRAAFVKMDARSWRFRISNVGKAAARDVQAEFVRGRGAIIASEIQHKLPIALLEPGDRVDLVAAPHMQSARRQTVKLLWADGASKSNEKTLDVQLF